MARITLAPQLARWLPGHDGAGEVVLIQPGETLDAALASLFNAHPNLRSYVLDEHCRIRRHVDLFVDGLAMPHGSPREQPLGEHSEIHILQALSGG